MLVKLIHLWQLNINPIDMQMLMRGVANGSSNDRRCAATAFYTLLGTINYIFLNNKQNSTTILIRLDLNKLELVKLHKVDGSNLIHHISKTPKLDHLLISLDI